MSVTVMTAKLPASDERFAQPGAPSRAGTTACYGRGIPRVLLHGGIAGSGAWIASSGNSAVYELDVTGEVAHGGNLAGLNADPVCKLHAPF